MKIHNIKDIIFKISPKQISHILNQLTDAPELEPERIYEIITELSSNHNIFIMLNEDNKKIIGMVTLLIEQKLIHGGRCVAHIEDLVVDLEYRKLGIGKQLIDFCKTYANQNNCYKIILDCADETRKFYEKNKFIHKNCGMALYF